MDDADEIVVTGTMAPDELTGEQLCTRQARDENLDKEGDIESKERSDRGEYASKDKAGTGATEFQRRREKMEVLLTKEGRERLLYCIVTKDYESYHPSLCFYAESKTTSIFFRRGTVSRWALSLFSHRCCTINTERTPVEFMH